MSDHTFEDHEDGARENYGQAFPDYPVDEAGADQQESLFGGGSKIQSAAVSTAPGQQADNGNVKSSILVMPSPTAETQSQDEPHEQAAPQTIGIISLVPEGDLLIVVSNYTQPNLAPFVRQCIKNFGPSERDPKAHQSELPDEIHIRVFGPMMRHMAAGFSVILRTDGAMSELSKDGTRIYRDTDDAAEAMIILVLILFGKYKSVPRIMGLELLSDICTIVDKYQMSGAVQVWMDIWAASFSNPRIRDFEQSSSIPAALCVAHALRLQPLLRSVVMSYLMDGAEPLSMQDKPFPARVIEKLNAERDTLVGKFPLTLNTILAQYLNNIGTLRCIKGKPECDAMAHGSLVTQLRQSEVFCSKSGSPHEVDLANGRSVREGIRELKSMRLSTLCALANSYQAREDIEIHGQISKLARSFGKPYRAAAKSVVDAWLKCVKDVE